MFATLRGSMTWLHTWAGLLLGSVLFAIFWMGTLSVFDKEIDRWMMPETRLTLPSEAPSLDTIASTVRSAAPEDTPRWQFTLPTARDPVIRASYRDGRKVVRMHIDPNNFESLGEPQSFAGTGFIFPFHFALHLRPFGSILGMPRLGYWVVGIAAMAMLVLLTSGVIIHKKLIADFFTFRSSAKLPRSSLDLHNVTGVIGLPFHFMMTLSGLIIFFLIYFPTVFDRTYGGEDNNEFRKEAFGDYVQEVADAPGGDMVSLDELASRATAEWGGSLPYYVRVWNPADANGTIEFRRNRQNSVPLNVDLVSFDADSGEVYKTHSSGPILGAQRWLAGFHFVQFDHWLLRWAYFGLGLTGCTLVATGFLVWFSTRRKRHVALGLRGVRVVESLAIGSVTGIIVATLAFFVANRLIPSGSIWFGVERLYLELWAFYLVWLSAIGHAFLRGAQSSAWFEQCVAIAALAITAVVLNSLTTGEHIIRSLTEGHPGVAGVDCLLLAGAGVALFAASRLRSKVVAHDASESLPKPAVEMST